MAKLTINNISDDLLKKLERSARENRRTVEEEAVSWLTDEILSRPERGGCPGKASTESNQELDPWLEIARRHRESMPNFYIDDEEELNRFKREGRL